MRGNPIKGAGSYRNRHSKFFTNDPGGGSYSASRASKEVSVSNWLGRGSANSHSTLV